MDKRNQQAYAKAAEENKTSTKIIRNTGSNGDDYYIKPYENVVVVYNSASWTQDLFLPRVAEAKGMILHIVVPDYGGGGTIYDNGDTLADWSDLNMNADNEYATLRCTGRQWIVLKSDM
ncbi:hypothetical protein LCGC14_0395100 [marine sediment metagenome]|uniref:Uncharacterized protein n=1 Tax=marine sediment metagenome TaxID=412755 RepID=A0A0F9SYB8_9ZZZZ